MAEIFEIMVQALSSDEISAFIFKWTFISIFKASLCSAVQKVKSELKHLRSFFSQVRPLSGLAKKQGSCLFKVVDYYLYCSRIKLLSMIPLYFSID